MTDFMAGFFRRDSYIGVKSADWPTSPYQIKNNQP
jgi:hypothetical protein